MSGSVPASHTFSPYRYEYIMYLVVVTVTPWLGPPEPELAETASFSLWHLHAPPIPQYVFVLVSTLSIFTINRLTTRVGHRIIDKYDYIMYYCWKVPDSLIRYARSDQTTKQSFLYSRHNYSINHSILGLSVNHLLRLILVDLRLLYLPMWLVLRLIVKLVLLQKPPAWGISDIFLRSSAHLPYWLLI